MERAQFGSGVGAEAVGEHGADLVVGGQCLGGAPGVAQGPQPQRLKGFVDRVLGAQGDQFGQGLVRAPEREDGAEPVAMGVQPPGLPAGGGGQAVGQVGQDRAAPQAERVVEHGSGLRRVALLQCPRALPASRSKRWRSTASGSAASR